VYTESHDGKAPKKKPHWSASHINSQLKMVIKIVTLLEKITYFSNSSLHSVFSNGEKFLWYLSEKENIPHTFSTVHLNEK
jgi:hypothetical protein